MHSDESDARLKAQKITSYKDNEMKKEVHYKNDLTDSLISNIPNKNHFIEIRRCQKRLSTTSVSSSSRSTLPKKKIKVEDIKVEKADSGGVQGTSITLCLKHHHHNTNKTTHSHTISQRLNTPYSYSFER